MIRLPLPPMMAVPREWRGGLSARDLLLDHWRSRITPRKP